MKSQTELKKQHDEVMWKQCWMLFNLYLFNSEHCVRQRQT